MAMTNCPECQKDVSDTAFKCPNCGAQLRKPKRSFMGKLFKWSFIGFNVLMIIWVVNVLGSGSEVYQGASSDSERTGVALGAGIGMMFIMTIWVIADIILGLFVLFTRPKS